MRVKLEEDMRQAFMRGVTALNLEAISVLKRGVPHAAHNPPGPFVPAETGEGAGRDQTMFSCMKQRPGVRRGGRDSSLP